VTETQHTGPVTRADFPEVGANRFWAVKHNPKSVSTPVTIELREFQSEQAKTKGMHSLSSLVGLIYCTADRADLLAAAFKLEARVGNIDNVVGVY